MNTSILKKCLDELSKTTPDISYIRGMLETLVELQPREKFWEGITTDNSSMHINVDNVYKGSYPSLTPASDPTPEGMAVDAALASLQGVKPKMDSLTIEKNIIL